jgi:hypothetical protein
VLAYNRDISSPRLFDFGELEMMAGEMLTAQNILTELANHGASVVVIGDKLRVAFTQQPSSAVAPLLPELRKRKGEVIALLKSSQRTINGYTVRRIIWETDKAIVFEDGRGHFLRYLHAYKKSWPVIVGRKKESA